MTQLQVEIVNVSQPTHTTIGGGGYNSIEVAYKEDGKIKGKTLRDFAERGAFNALRNATTGSFYLIGVTKNAKGYFQWDSAEQTTAKAVMEEESTAKNPTASLAQRYTAESPAPTMKLQKNEPPSKP